MIKKINIETNCNKCLLDITAKIQAVLPKKSGVCLIFVPHTTAGVTINEGADKDVSLDIINHLQKLIPKNAQFLHIEGNSDAHIVSSLIGTSTEVIVENGSLLLGTWQKIFFVEFDGPRTRSVYIKFIEG
ncbi:MAG TPA: YjbQ family protein [Desulfurella acetivorans]|uniref:YjbQ family protein n=1 Tax=Desulfurella acetivorans TaxID=33002 RepID=A0A7C6EAS9_DESAE|nr:YjbQ family protein [Desulfurella acetivorans]